MLKSKFSIFGGGGGGSAKFNYSSVKSDLSPIIKLQTDKDVYRPGDSIFVTIEVSYPSNGASQSMLCSLLIEKLGFEIKGVEKLDPQWFATQKPLSRSRQRRGEHIFMDCSAGSLISNQILSSGAKKTFVVRTLLPSIIPPSYRGASIRYLYYVKGTLYGRWLLTENGLSDRVSSEDPIELEARVPLQLWVTQKSNGLLMDGQSDGIVPPTTLQLDAYWKSMDGDSEWARVNDIDDGIEEGYDSSKDEISSVSSYNPSKELHKAFGSSLSLQSFASRSLTKDPSFIEGRSSLSSSTLALPQVSVAEVLYDSSADMSSPQKLSSIVSSNKHENILQNPSAGDTIGESSEPGTGPSEPAASESFIRGRSYNIRMDDQVLLRFSPKNSDSTYYFSDMIGGTLTFFHEVSRRVLEVSITLETSETINRQFIHPSRRNCSTITKVQSDHHEVVADLVQTSFLFSVPMDGPMSFSTPHVTVTWALRFEFFTTPKNVDWARYEHPLLVDGRDKSEWVLPITVHATPAVAQAAHTRDEKHFSLEPLWVRT